MSPEKNRANHRVRGLKKDARETEQTLVDNPIIEVPAMVHNFPDCTKHVQIAEQACFNNK